MIDPTCEMYPGVLYEKPAEWDGIEIVPDPCSPFPFPIVFVPIERVVPCDLLVPYRSRKIVLGMRKPNPVFSAAIVEFKTRAGYDDISPRPDRSHIVRWVPGDFRIFDGNHRRNWVKRNGFKTLPAQILSPLYYEKRAVRLSAAHSSIPVVSA
jgi:hypothetical protein